MSDRAKGSRMSDIHSTIFRFEAVSKELGIEEHPYIKKMLEKEKQETILAQKQELAEVRDNMHLYLAGNNHLLTDKRLVDSDCAILAKLLQNNVFIISLDLRYNNITDDGITHLAKLIEESTSLEQLNLMCNDFTEVGAERLAKSLHKNCGLRVLRLNGNKIGNKGGMFFAQMLQINSTLLNLDLGDTDLTTESIIALATVMCNNKSLLSLNVNRPILFSEQEEVTVHFAKMLKVNTILQELHLQKFMIRDFGATRLAECLMENFTLQYLDLSCNRITRDGVKELAKVLALNTAIRELDLSFNRLEDDGAIHIANALSTTNTNLEMLDIRSNNIKGKGLCALSDALKMNSTLCKIFIWGNVLEESAAIAFSNLISTGRMKRLDTDVQPYVVDGKTILSELTHYSQRHYYYAPSYGDDVPVWQPKGKNPRGSDIKAYSDIGRQLMA